MATPRLAVRKIAIFCGSANGVAAVYVEAARQIGRELARRKLGLIYGGGGTGLMGELAREMLAAGGKVTGVMPRFMVEQEAELKGLDDMHLMDTMHERKAKMAELADAFIALPGGIGTLEEIFEAWTHTVLGLAKKPCGLLNTNGFYNSLLDFTKHATHEGFIRAHAFDHLAVNASPGALLDALTRP